MKYNVCYRHSYQTIMIGTYRRIIVRETKIGGFLEPAIIKATEFNISLQPSASFRIDEITECATSKRK